MAARRSRRSPPTRHKKRKAAAPPSRTNDPEKTRQDILDVATHEFAAKGLSGARIDEIAERIRTSKRMIYYYFGSKEALYLAVLEEAYGRIRRIESSLDLEHLAPLEAMAQLVGFTFDYQTGHPDFIRLVVIENIHEGAHIARSKVIQELNVTAIDALRKLCKRGQAEGVFRDNLDPIDLHMSISALCNFNIVNRFTFSTIFKHDMASPRALAARRAQVIDLIVRYVRRRPRPAPQRHRSLTN
jgi:AcrR family transcriptional regulator